MITYYSEHNGAMPGLQDMVKWQEDGWALMKAWSAARRPVGLPYGSKHSMSVGRRQPCTAWMLAMISNSNWWQLAC